MDSGTGCAIWFPKYKFSKLIPLPINTSIYKAEELAILQSLLTIESLKDKNCIICSDSRSTLKAIERFNKGNYSPPLIPEIISKLDSLIRSKIVNFLWIPGHRGISGNITVYRFARETVSSGVLHHLVMTLRPT